MTGIYKVIFTDEMDYDTIYALLQRNYDVWTYEQGNRRKLCIGTHSKSILSESETLRIVENYSIGYETCYTGETYEPLVDLMRGNKIIARVEYQTWSDKTVEDLIDDRPLSIDDIKDYLLD